MNDSAAPLVCLYHGGLKKSTNLGHYRQVHSEDAYYGHLVLRLMASFVLFYTSRVICKGRLTREAIIFSLKHYWRFVDAEALELQALS